MIVRRSKLHHKYSVARSVGAVNELVCNTVDITNKSSTKALKMFEIVSTSHERFR